jgi:alpha-D-xyloside xylohydrolase
MGNKILNQAPDTASAFFAPENLLFTAARLDGDSFREGVLTLRREEYKARMSFNQMNLSPSEAESWEFPPVYGRDLLAGYSLDFITERTLRIKLTAPGAQTDAEPSLMLCGEVPEGADWAEAGTGIFKGRFGSVTVTREPFRLTVKDAKSRTLFSTVQIEDRPSLLRGHPMPLAAIRNVEDLTYNWAFSYQGNPDDKFYGCGESFTPLNKKGQRVSLHCCDAYGTMSPRMYKPVPFYYCSAGYGVFLHTSAAADFDFGYNCCDAVSLFSQDRVLDVFVFFGTPAEVLSEYTALTGRPECPPLWSFGLWMSRITYKTRDEVEAVARKMRELDIPCDVIHIDTGWFDKDWLCDFEFSKERFPEPEKMLSELNKNGFKVSLWQLPYFTPANPLYGEIIEKGLHVKASDGGLPTEDAVLDFSNPEAESWYQGKLRTLFKAGVFCIKADFGEAAPVHGLYASGKTGRVEHNLYPLRYNKTVADVTKKELGHGLIWARSAWAGSQRYPIHWGGDAENTDSGMAASLRGGMSLGMCGFTFWSHDAGGFVNPPKEEVYLRWMFAGVLSSHTRCHGAPPKEPWAFSEYFLNEFRKLVKLKYSLLPYIYGESIRCAQKGHPLLRPMFFDFNDDEICYTVENQYMLGPALLVAPLFEEAESRRVYIPEGVWFDFTSKERLEGGRYVTLDAQELHGVLLVREGFDIRLCEPAAHTGLIRLEESVSFKEWNYVLS